MKIKSLIFLALTCITLSGLTTIVVISVLDKKEITRLFDQNQVKVPNTHRAASISKGTILLLLVVGVIGVLGVNRKKKDITNSAPQKETTRGS
jgi:hypothetical protein